MTKSPTRKAIFIICATLGVGLLFQNCANYGLDFGSESSGTSSEGTAIDHPGGSAPMASSQGPILANRYHIQSLLMDTFKDPAMADSAGNNRVLSKIIVETIVKKAGTFGVPCDTGNPLLDVNAGDDCDGVIVAPMYQPATTLRAAFKIQACEQILGNDIFVNNLLKKIAGAQSPVNEANVAILMSYFYRGDDPDPRSLTGLLRADQVAVANDPQLTLLNRWRLLMTAVCESTGWEML